MISIRPATADDSESIAQMARALSLADGGRPSQFSAENFRRDGFGEAPAFAALIAENGSEIAGYAIYYPGYDTDSATRGIYLADLFVHENLRRQGIGRALIASVAQKSRDSGARWMFWSVLRRNRAGRRFYKKIAPELKDVIVCAAFGKTFDRLADMSVEPAGEIHSAADLTRPDSPH